MKIKIKVIAGARSDKIEKVDDGYKVHLTERAEKGRANKALIEFLAEYFKCKKNDVEIINGLKSNKKIITLK